MVLGCISRVSKILSPYLVGFSITIISFILN
nr:MAG TPA: hypothetical protein [Caudoviricetes sp.]